MRSIGVDRWLGMTRGGGGEEYVEVEDEESGGVVDKRQTYQGVSMVLSQQDNHCNLPPILIATTTQLE